MIHSVRARVSLLALVALAAVAAVVVALTRHTAGSPQMKPVGDWYGALAAPYTPAGAKTACGVRVTPAVVGVAHPVLPCGAKLFVAFGGKQVLTQVIDRAQVAPGREFHLTGRLARLLGLHGTQRIRWRFAR